MAKEIVFNWAQFWDAKSQDSTDFQATGRSIMDVTGFLYLVRDCALALELNPSDEMLDIGCGTGQISLALSPFVNSVHACDISQGMIDRAQKNLSDVPNASVSLGTITDSGRPAASADKVLCYSVLQYLRHEQDARDAFLEIKRVLKPDGRAFLAANPDPARQEALVDVINDNPDPKSKALGLSLLDKTLWLAPKRAEEIARECGFEAKSAQVHPRIWQTFYMYDLTLWLAN